MSNQTRVGQRQNTVNEMISNTRNISDIINDFTNYDMKLQEYGKYVPSDAEQDFSILTNKQNALLDQQQNLLNEAQTMQIDSIEDVTALLKLWYLEEVNHMSSNQLSKSQLLILNVYSYLVNTKT